jgi:predicted transcriptional regulator
MKSESRFPQRIGDLQLRILRVLWSRGEASVADVHADLSPEKPLAYTTVATMLRKMETRGWVSHREVGRAFLYKAKLAADSVNRGFGGYLVERLFKGSVAEAVSHLLSTREVTSDELDRIEALVDEARRRKL